MSQSRAVRYHVTLPWPGSRTGWEQVTDEASGHFYYFNIATSESTWEPPSINRHTGRITAQFASAVGCVQVDYTPPEPTQVLVV